VYSTIPSGTPVNFVFTYDTDNLPDQVKITDALAAVLVDSGCVGTDHISPETAGVITVPLVLTAAQWPLTIEVIANCNGTTRGTGWRWTLKCAAFPPPPPPPPPGTSYQLARCSDNVLVDLWVEAIADVVGWSVKYESVCYRVTAVTGTGKTNIDVEQFYHDCTHCVADVECHEVMSDVLSNDTVYFDGGAVFPAGNYKVRYLRGALSYGGGTGGAPPAGTCGVDFGPDLRVGDGLFIHIEPTAGAPSDTLIPGSNNVFCTNAEVEADNAGLSVVFSHPGGQIGIRCLDFPFNDNYTVGEAPVFELCPTSETP
jgi:hypothetical protein